MVNSVYILSRLWSTSASVVEHVFVNYVEFLCVRCFVCVVEVWVFGLYFLLGYLGLSCFQILMSAYLGICVTKMLRAMTQRDLIHVSAIRDFVGMV